MRRVGTQTALGENERKELEDALSFWRNKSNEYYENRAELEKAFYQVWKGASASGLVLDEDDEKAWPFDGASDQRVRWGDRIYADQAALILTALSAAKVEIKCPGDRDAERRARALGLLLKWELNKMGADGIAQIMAMLHYCLVDSPAVAALDVSWRRRVTLGVETTTREILEDEFVAWRVAISGGQMSEVEASGRFLEALRGDGSQSMQDLERFLVESKRIRKEDAFDVIAGLAEDGEVEYLAYVDLDEGPELKALRYGDDFCVPILCTNFDYASPWFRGEWVTEGQLRERIAGDGWDPEWVEETILHKGTEFYNENGSVPSSDDVRDLCNICWCYTVSTNSDGETVRYVSVISHADGSAFGKRVVRSRRGKWNTMLFRREVLSGNILEGRGLAEICAPDQGVAKSIRDGAANNAIVGSLPPVKAKGAKARNALVAPFEIIKMGTSDDIAFMQPPAYPAAAKESEAKIKSELWEYVGLPTEGNPDVSSRQRQMVAWMLAQFKELYVTLLEVAQDNASDEVLAGITADGDVRGLRREDVTGGFGLTLELDPTNLDWTVLKDKLTTLSQILLGMDREGVIDRSPVVTHAFGLLFPELSATSLRSPEEMVGNDLEDEKKNFVLIKAGIMPRMDTEGRWNYAARLEFYQKLQQENPDALADMSPRAQEMLQQWLSALQMQQTQYGDNAQIGRTGVESVEAR